jgi:CHASE3 domain sensor protein
MRLSVGRKLVLGFLPVVLTVASLGALTYRELGQLHELADTQDELTDRAQGVMLLSLKIKDLQGLAIHYIGAHEPKYREQFGSAKRNVLSDFDKLSQSAAGASESDAWGDATRACST